ncbi:MAG: hypothetical protein K9G48_04555 [Reyranella sp.]|nr:hypothetical protein [Reyranella sp.]
MLLVIALSAVASGCSFAPVAELKIFRESVVAANTAATPVIDEISVTERRTFRSATATEERAQFKSGEPVAFKAVEASYFSDVGDGPAAIIFRRGHSVLDRLSDVLLGLATGAGAEADVSTIESLVSELGGLLDVVQPGGGTAVAAAQKLLHDALIEVSKELQRREARRIIAAVNQTGLVKKITDRLIAGTPQMFAVMVSDARLRVKSVRATAESPVVYAERVAKVRLVLSNYVVLLNRVPEAWDEAAKAAESKTSGNVAVLAERVGELRAAAVATRKAYADMNASR